MKPLDALVSIWWSLAALATLYVVLHTPADVEPPRHSKGSGAACEALSGPVMLRVLTTDSGAR